MKVEQKSLACKVSYKIIHQRKTGVTHDLAGQSQGNFEG